MKRRNPSHGLGFALLLCLPLAGCLSLSKSDALSVEVMDPLPILLAEVPVESDSPEGKGVSIDPVGAVSSIGEQLRVRAVVGLVEDSETRLWAMPPAELVDLAIANIVYGSSEVRAQPTADTSGRLRVHLQRFEVDLTEGDAFVLDARWSFLWRPEGEARPAGRVRIALPLADRGAATISAAAAEAIHQLIDQLPSS